MQFWYLFQKNNHPTTCLTIDLFQYNQVYLKYISSLKILSYIQFGFRPNESTISLLHKLNSLIRINLNSGYLSVIIFLDYSKAFDTVPHHILIKKLLCLKFGTFSVETIISYLRERTIKTRVDNKLSSPLNLLAGVPQGSILGPMLFNIFVSDLKCGLDCDVQILQYADDCQLLLKFDKEAKFEEIIQKVERVIGQVSKWSEDNLLILNNDKTQILPIYNRNSVFSKMPFFSKHNFTFMKEAKILGVFYNFGFNWSTRFNHILSTMRKSIYHMKQFFRRYTTKSDYFIRKRLFNYFIFFNVLWNRIIL